MGEDQGHLSDGNLTTAEFISFLAESVPSGTNGQSQHGSSGNDWLYGTNRANDSIYGYDGNDTIYGAAGEDTLSGGGGNDMLIGGADNDTFIFVDGFGEDTITDFSTGDLIDLTGVATINEYGDLMANHATQVGADVVVDDLVGNTILIESATLSSLLSSDFSV